MSGGASAFACVALLRLAGYHTAANYPYGTLVGSGRCERRGPQPCVEIAWSRPVETGTGAWVFPNGRPTLQRVAGLICPPCREWVRAGEALARIDAE